MAKDLIIIAGPNGAGKSTLANMLSAEKSFLPFVNADIIAKGLSAHSDGKDIAAGRIMLERLHSALNSDESVAFETTLSGRSWIKLIKQAKDKGYQVSLSFIAVYPVETAINRVANRVSEGGHDIPEDVIRRRYPRSLSMFFETYNNLANHWFFFDNTEINGNLIAYRSSGQEVVVNSDIYEIYKRTVS